MDKHAGGHTHPHAHADGHGHAHPHPAGHTHTHERAAPHADPHPHPHPHDVPHTSGHGHVHHPHGHAGQRAMGVVLAGTALFCGIEALAGWWTGSLALLSDAAHMLTDTLALTIAFVASRMRRAPRAGRSTFGLRRIPVLAGAVNAILVLAAAAGIVVEAVERLGTPRVVSGAPVVAVAVAGLVVNLAGAWLLHRSGETGVNLRGALLHMLGDALGSLAALVAGVVIMTTGFTLVDPIASLVVAGIIAVGAVRLLADVASILLERAPAHVDVESLKKLASRLAGVEQVVGLHAWELDSGEAVASLVLVTDERDLTRLAATADALRRELLDRYRIAHATIEWRPRESPRPCCSDDGDAVAARAQT